MNIFYKLLILAMIVATSGLFVIKGPQGKPFLSYKDFVPDVSKYLQQAKEVAAKVPVGQAQTAGSSAQTTTPAPALKKNDFYKWKDAYGSWQFTQDPPPSKKHPIFCCIC